MARKIAVPPDLIGGVADEGYGAVADAFRANFAAGREIGAAVCVYRDGVKVVDLWGGYRDGRSGSAWQPDTLATLFSTTKGISALCVAIAVSRHLLDYDARVADYWPEFAQHGKADITVRQLLAHQAGLPVLTPVPTLRDAADPDRLATILAAQKPAWAPGSRHGYHAVTIGWYQSELIRRVDPHRRTLGRFLADEVAAPLGLDLYIGLPKTVDRDRIAYIDEPSPTALFRNPAALPPGLMAASFSPRSLITRALRLPGGVKPIGDFANRDEIRALEIPAANGIATADAVARAYGSAAAGGAELGLTPMVFDALTAPARRPPGGNRDKVLHSETSYSLGFWKPFDGFQFGSSQRAFGTPGAGGSFGFADPDTGVGYGYLMNQAGLHVRSDPRELAIRQTLFGSALGARPQS